MKKFFVNLYRDIKKADVFSQKMFAVLYSVAFACILIIGVAQLGLRNTSVRHFFTDVDKYEGAYFEATAEIEDKEQNIILYAEGENFQQAEIWINGESYSALTAGDNEVKIADTSVIEIYSPKSRVDVKLIHMTEGLTLYTAMTEVTVENEIKLFGRIGVK